MKHSRWLYIRYLYWNEGGPDFWLHLFAAVISIMPALAVSNVWVGVGLFLIAQSLLIASTFDKDWCRYVDAAEEIKQRLAAPKVRVAESIDATAYVQESFSDWDARFEQVLREKNNGG